MLKIKEFATLCNCSIYTLRYYDEIELLKPKVVCKNSGYRYYSEEQLERYLEIKELQDIGFSVQDIKGMKNLSNLEISILILKQVNYLQEKLEKAVTLMTKYTVNSKSQYQKK